jgi:dienelactone hydrolase
MASSLVPAAAAILLLWTSPIAEAQSGSAWEKLSPYFTPPPEFAGDLGNFDSPLKSADGSSVKSAEDWPRRRQEILNTWHQRMGPWPPLVEKPKVVYLGTEERENFTQHRVHVQIASDGKMAEGYLLVPRGEGPFPAVVVPFYEAGSSIGLLEKSRGLYDFGYQLARRGFVTLSIGTPGSIEYPGKDTRDLLVVAGERYGCQPLSFLAYVAANCHTALTQLPQVDRQRIGMVGLSYGGKWSMFASCLYDKFACAVWSDPGIVFDETNRSINYWEPWYLGFELGKFRKPGVPTDENPRTGLYRRLIEQGHDLVDLHALMAPRPFLVSGGTEDGPQRWRALNHTIAVNRLLGYENRVGLTSRSTHIPTPEAAEQTCLFFEHFLKPNGK